LKAAGLGNRLLFATDPGYEPQIATWWAENSRLRPYCLILPRSPDEVSVALTALANANSGAGDWHIAVRSGGHGTTGSSSIARGVTIDLSMMNSTRYDRDSNVARIEPGGRWRDVYGDLEREGVTVSGGRDGDVGVGGFLLGGGNSFFTGRMGFGCDSVLNYEIVLANGTIVNANRTANADLWQGLKGGGNNFGIVTRVDMEAIPTRDLFYHLRFMNYSHSEALIDTVVEFADQDQSLADNALIAFYRHDTSFSPDIHIAAIYVNTLGSGNATTAFDKVKDLPAISNITVLQNMAEAAAGSQLASGYKFVSRTFPT
jgi:FAD/FMN-containing dehydrogenase